MKLISIDVGIKNLAICLFEIQPDISSFTVLKWDIINLTQQSDIIQCGEKDKKEIICTKPAKYKKHSKAYCVKHSKKAEYKIPTLDLQESTFQKQSMKKLSQLAMKHQVPFLPSTKKNELIIHLKEHLALHYLEPIEKINCNTLDLVVIGRNIQIKLDALLQNNIDTVIIENQISPIANRMKTIQGMIAQYFIMKQDTIQIDFVNAANKLKTNDISLIEKKEKTTYADRKKEGIERTMTYLQTNSSLFSWQSFYESHQKKDDLADCFLQGIWYIHHKIK